LKKPVVENVPGGGAGGAPNPVVRRSVEADVDIENSLAAVDLGQADAQEAELRRRFRAAGMAPDRPTIAANRQAPIPSKLLAAFEAADLSQAEWMRLPAPRARCGLSGLSRTTLNELAERKVIRTISVRQPGATRGIKLILRASLLGYLSRLDLEQNGGEAATRTLPD
jgi:hypothetical protein